MPSCVTCAMQLVFFFVNGDENKSIIIQERTDLMGCFMDQIEGSLL
jgi:hypothetical protein